MELAAIGNEGMAGTSLVLGVTTSPATVVCRISGAFMRMSAGTFVEQLYPGSALLPIVQRYTQALADQISLRLLCNKIHPLEQRLPGWLLAIHDKVGVDELHLTQEAIAYMLGVRRPTVTEMIWILQDEGLVRNARGRVTILDRPRLEARACPCYSIARRDLEVAAKP